MWGNVKFTDKYGNVFIRSIMDWERPIHEQVMNLIKLHGYAEKEPREYTISNDDDRKLEP